jgi:hypothetical protein
MVWNYKIASFFLMLLFVTHVDAQVDSELNKFPPFPKNEFLTFWDNIESPEKDDNGEKKTIMVVIETIMYESIYNENGTIYFTSRHRSAGNFALEEVRRQSYACRTQSLKVLEQKFAAYKEGIYVDADKVLVGVAKVLFAQPNSNVANILQGTCKLFNQFDQTANNMAFHGLLQTMHNLVLRSVSKHDDFILSLIASENIDYLKAYTDNKSESATFTNGFKLIAINKCGGDKACWDGLYRLVNLSSTMGCLGANDLPKEFQSELCSKSIVEIE